MRLIDADVLKFEFMENGDDHTGYEIHEVIDNAPTVDAIEIVHAYWIWDGYDYEKPWTCSKCRCHSESETNYCPDCGAKMDGDVDDADG